MASKRTFRKPKSAEEEKKLLENAVPQPTRSVNKWSMKIFSEWQAARLNKKASDEQSNSVDDSSKIQDLDMNVCNMSVETLNFWLRNLLWRRVKRMENVIPLERVIVFVVVFNTI